MQPAQAILVTLVACSIFSSVLAEDSGFSHPKADLIDLRFSQGTPIYVLIRYYSSLTRKPVWVSSEVDPNSECSAIIGESLTANEVILMVRDAICSSANVQVSEFDGAFYIAPVETHTEQAEQGAAANP